MTGPWQEGWASWDGEGMLIRRDLPTGAWIVIAVHSSRLGPATGGTRMKRYPDLGAAVEDALALARGMTYKYAVAGFPRGGGKAVIALEAPLAPEARRGLLLRYGDVIRGLGGWFATGPDVGTNAEDMDVIAETGHPYVFSRTPAAGGAGGSGPFTAAGVFSGIEAACGRVLGSASMEGRTVVVQGVGAVGGALVGHLLEAGARVLVSDVDPAIRASVGVRFPEAEWVGPDEVMAIECDVLSPCALGGVLHPESIRSLRARLVVGGANNQISSADDADALAERGTIYVPDFVVNVGGAMGITGMELMGWTRDEADRRVREGVRDAVERVLALAERRGCTPLEAARAVGDERLAAGD